MKIVFGCDPNATEFKLQLMEYVKGLGHEVADLGSDDPIYANTAIEVAKAVNISLKFPFIIIFINLTTLVTL